MSPKRHPSPICLANFAPTILLCTSILHIALSTPTRGSSVYPVRIPTTYAAPTTGTGQSNGQFGTARSDSPSIDSSRVPTVPPIIGRDIPRPILNVPSGIEAAGKEEWEGMVKIAEREGKSGSSCWNLAVQRFRDSSLDCKASKESTKSLLALALTECHFIHRPRGGFPTVNDGCRLIEVFDKLKEPEEEATEDGELNGSIVDEPTLGSALAPDPSDSLSPPSSEAVIIAQHPPTTEKKMILKWDFAQPILNLCINQMSDAAHGVYINFFNHIDNICFHIQSSVWQEQTEDLVHRLSLTSVDVLRKLDEAAIRNELLAKQQTLALEFQQRLQEGSDRLMISMDSGQQSLSKAFGVMREEVQEEQSRLLAAFGDAMAMIRKVLDLQRWLTEGISSFETVMVYTVSLILTHFTTASDATKKARPWLYFLWLIMVITEVSMRKFFDRVYGVFDPFVSTDDDRIHLIEAQRRLWINRLRGAGVGVGTLHWVYSWWSYRDPWALFSERLTGVMEAVAEIKTHLNEAGSHHALIGIPRDPKLLNIKAATDAARVLRLDDRDLFDNTDSDDPEFIPIFMPSVTPDNQTPATISATEYNSNVKSNYPESGHVSGSRRRGRSCHERRNPSRRARPIAYRSPRVGCLEDFTTRRLNPLTLFESPKDFARSLGHRRSISLSNFSGRYQDSFDSDDVSFDDRNTRKPLKRGRDDRRGHSISDARSRRRGRRERSPSSLSSFSSAEGDGGNGLLCLREGGGGDSLVIDLADDQSDDVLIEGGEIGCTVTDSIGRDRKESVDAAILASCRGARPEIDALRTCENESEMIRLRRSSCHAGEESQDGRREVSAISLEANLIYSCELTPSAAMLSKGGPQGKIVERNSAFGSIETQAPSTSTGSRHEAFNETPHTSSEVLEPGSLRFESNLGVMETPLEVVSTAASLIPLSNSSTHRPPIHPSKSFSEISSKGAIGQSQSVSPIEQNDELTLRENAVPKPRLSRRRRRGGELAALVEASGGSGIDLLINAGGSSIRDRLRSRRPVINDSPEADADGISVPSKIAAQGTPARRTRRPAAERESAAGSKSVGRGKSHIKIEPTEEVEASNQPAVPKSRRRARKAL